MINVVLNFVYRLLEVLIPNQNVIQLPPEVVTYTTMAIDYIAEGSVLLSQFVDLKYLFCLYIIVLEVDITIFAYRVAMWILRKVPFLGIK